MSISKHPDELYRSQVFINSKPVQKYAKTREEAEKLDAETLNEAKDKGSYIFERMSRKNKGEFVSSTMPLINKEGAPRYLHIIRRVKNGKKKGITFHYSISFKFLGKRGGARKAFSITKDGFEAAFKEATDYGAEELELTRRQLSHWKTGKTVLRDKYLAWIKKDGES